MHTTLHKTGFSRQIHHGGGKGAKEGGRGGDERKGGREVKIESNEGKHTAEDKRRRESRDDRVKRKGGREGREGVGL